MSKLVNRSKKRVDIAKSTCELFIKEGFVNISISQIANQAGIGKGTVYQYFENKEDIIFELMSCLQKEYDPKLQAKLLKSSSVKQKVLALFDLFISDDEKVLIQKQIYKEFLAIYLNNPSDQIRVYQKQMKDKYTDILINIFNEAILNNELRKESINFVDSVFATIEGFFIVNDDQKQIVNYIESLLELLQKRG